MKKFDYKKENIFYHPISLKEVIESKNRRRGKKINDIFGRYFCENCKFDNLIKYEEEDIYYAIEKNPLTEQLTMSFLVQCPDCKKWTFIGGIV